MSADNAIFIIYWGEFYYVWHGSLSADYYEPADYENEFYSKDEAVSFAHQLHDRIGYTEGGIIWIIKEEQEKNLQRHINFLQERLDNLRTTGYQFPLWQKP